MIHRRICLFVCLQHIISKLDAFYLNVFLDECVRWSFNKALIDSMFLSPSEADRTAKSMHLNHFYMFRIESSPTFLACHLLLDRTMKRKVILIAISQPYTGSHRKMRNNAFLPNWFQQNTYHIDQKMISIIT